jgi:DNA repair protein RadC
MSKVKLHKNVKIRSNKSGYPSIALKGSWLEEYGFKKNTDVFLEAEQARIFLYPKIQYKEIQPNKSDHTLESIVRAYSSKSDLINHPYRAYLVRLHVEYNSDLNSPSLNSPEKVYEFVKSISHNDKERMISIMLNTRCSVIGVDEVSIGTGTYSLIDPKEVFKSACLCNATSIILAHNHPSGDPTPSEEDVTLTKRLKKATSLLGLDLLDHLVIGYEKYYSMASHDII